MGETEERGEGETVEEGIKDREKGREVKERVGRKRLRGNEAIVRSQ